MKIVTGKEAIKLAEMIEEFMLLGDLVLENSLELGGNICDKCFLKWRNQQILLMEEF